MDPSGVKPFEATPAPGCCFARHAKDYARLSATPDQFKAFAAAVALMQQTQPNYSVHELAKVSVPVRLCNTAKSSSFKNSVRRL
jgi:hypothetical protein